ncbi:HNH endonuclease [Rubinisphaera sp. JC750]|uniref:HNH endonuclease n=1 Tax=Rubinisphaera sp. JC750 TaxID=2898658 RepID=UPI001F20EFCE|nr:HNH endonuclease [Rubinisphaera sp. JC750]
MSLTRTQLRDEIKAVLATSPALNREPDHFVREKLAHKSFDEDDYRTAANAVFTLVLAQCLKDCRIEPSEQNMLNHVQRLLGISDDARVELEYNTGLHVYKHCFRNATAKGQIVAGSFPEGERLRTEFGLRKTDIRKAIEDEALAYYSNELLTAAENGTLCDEAIAKLDALARHFGLPVSRLKELSVPNRTDILRNTLEEIKARGEITEADEEHVTRIAKLINAHDLLKPCLKDLELYRSIFQIRAGDLPAEKADTLILDRGEKLHFSIPIVYHTRDGRKLNKTTGTLYVGSIKLRFVSSRKAHTVSYRNILSVDFTPASSPKLSVLVASGGGTGDYKLAKSGNPGRLFEVSEAIQFLVRKAKGMEVGRGKSSRYIPADVRSEVWHRDGGRCVICDAGEYLEFDHIIPLAKGGATTTENLQILCRKCNSAKSDSI